MSDSKDEKTEEAEFNEALKRMLGKPPKPHIPSQVKKERPPPSEAGAQRRKVKER